MNCPVDNTPLTMAERTGVEIDYCPECRGVWLDRGELDKIIDRAATTFADDSSTASSPEHRGGHGGRQDTRRPRKKSFLGDLFDLG